MPPREVSTDLKRIFKDLKLGQLLPVLPERLRQARERQMDPEDVLLAVLSDEVQRRQSQRVQLRAQNAGLGSELVFEAWDPSAQITYDRHLLDQRIHPRNRISQGEKGGRTLRACRLRLFPRPPGPPAQPTSTGSGFFWAWSRHRWGSNSVILRSGQPAASLRSTSESQMSGSTPLRAQVLIRL